MEHWINRLLVGCGSASGFLLGTGHPGEGAVLAILAVVVSFLVRLRAHRGDASAEW